MSRTLLLLVVLVVDAANAIVVPSSPPPPPGNDRLTVFVSDLHLGVGHEPRTSQDSKDWHPTEDFRWHQEFHNFLQAMNERGAGRVDLVLVGDILELWQTVSGDESCEYEGNRGCNEAEAVTRTKRIVEQHARVFDSLREFVSPENTNHVTLVPGNHDVAFAFQGVRSLVLRAIAAPSDRVRIAVEGYWRSADGEVFAEHGQQVGKDPNKFTGWPLAPFAPGVDPPHLLQSWGENFVQQMFNRYEVEYPIIDNLSSESLGAKYAAKHLGWKATAAEAGKFVRFLLFQQTWRQAVQGLGDSDAPPQWLTDKIDVTSNEKCWTFLGESLDLDEPLRALLLNNAELRSGECELASDDLITACDRRWALQNAMPDNGITLCPHAGKLGSMVEHGKRAVDSRARAKAYQSRINDLIEALPKDRPADAFKIYVYGHTHQEHVACSPFPLSRRSPVLVINDGAWQRTADEAEFCRLTLGKDPKKVLAELRPEDLPGCYPFVLREHGEMRLRYWEQTDATSKGSVVSACQSATTVPPECQPLLASDACPAWPNK